jgi:8-hydroxy-5-deazaflavin:NADPH oxidoreductase
MKIAIIGPGKVGKALEAGWTRKGHEVRFGKRESNAAAVRWGDVVVLATPWPATKDAIAACGSLNGKIVLDATNPLLPTLEGMDHDSGPSGGEKVAAWAQGAKVVKIFNTTGFANMQNTHYSAGKPMMLYCGDDPEAKVTAKRLSDDLGFDSVDFGRLANARYSEGVAMTWIWLALKGGLGKDIALVLARR